MLHLPENYRAEVASFVSRTLQGEPDALRSAFGRTDADIEKDLREYILRQPLPRVNLPMAAGKIAAEPLSERGARH